MIRTNLKRNASPLLTIVAANQALDGCQSQLLVNLRAPVLSYMVQKCMAAHNVLSGCKQPVQLLILVPIKPNKKHACALMEEEIRLGNVDNDNIIEEEATVSLKEL